MAHRAAYPLALLTLFALFWTLAAIQPRDNIGFVFDTVLVLLAGCILVFMYRIIPLSNTSYTLIFVYFSIHALGAHYQYVHVPYDEWSRFLFGTGISEIFGFTRNNYDRLVHFSFGLLFFYPIREIYTKMMKSDGKDGYFIPLCIVVFITSFYEVLELLFFFLHGPAGLAYVGFGGDTWDTNKDIALVALGAVITLFINLVTDKINGQKLSFFKSYSLISG